MFIVGGFQVHSILRRDEHAFDMLSGRIGLIVVDEAHKAVAPTYKAAIQHLTGMNTSVVGLTATPVGQKSRKQRRWRNSSLRPK